MTVQELIDQLSRVDPGLQVLAYSEEAVLCAEGHSMRVLELDEVSTVVAEQHRNDDDQVPGFKFGKSELAKEFALIMVTADF